MTIIKLATKARILDCNFENLDSQFQRHTQIQNRVKIAKCCLEHALLKNKFMLDQIIFADIKGPKVPDSGIKPVYGAIIPREKALNQQGKLNKTKHEQTTTFYFVKSITTSSPNC